MAVVSGEISSRILFIPDTDLILFQFFYYYYDGTICEFTLLLNWSVLLTKLCLWCKKKGIWWESIGGGGIHLSLTREGKSFASLCHLFIFTIIGPENCSNILVAMSRNHSDWYENVWYVHKKGN